MRSTRRKPQRAGNEITESLLNPVMTESLAYLVGVMLGDGGVYGNSYTVFCRDMNREFAESIAKTVERIFNFKPRVNRGSPNCWIVSTNRRDIHRFFVKMGYPKGRKLTTLRIPKTFTEDKVSRLEVARGLFDAEGYCGVDKQKHGGKTYSYPYVGIDMIARPLIGQLHGILLEAGIESAISVKKPRAWGKNPQFSLVIKGLERVKKFRDAIGFRHPEKREKLERLVEGESSETIRQAPEEGDDMVHLPTCEEGSLR